MQSAKEALLKAGRIKEITRGRISLDNHAWLKSQYDTGIRFTDWPKGEVITSTGPTDETVVRVKRDPNITNEKVIAELRYRYDDENAWIAEDGAGKQYGMREACDNCKCSLIACFCESPRLFGKVVLVKPYTGKPIYTGKFW